MLHLDPANCGCLEAGPLAGNLHRPGARGPTLNQPAKTCQQKHPPLKLMNTMNPQETPTSNPPVESYPPRLRPNGKPWIHLTLEQAREVARQRNEERWRVAKKNMWLDRYLDAEGK